MVKTSTEILSLLQSNKDKLKEKYPISEIGIFGSYARGDQNAESDVDVIVDFNDKIGLEFIKLAHDLEDLLGTKIDLVHKKAIKPKYWPYIQKNLIYV